RASGRGRWLSAEPRLLPAPQGEDRVRVGERVSYGGSSLFAGVGRDVWSAENARRAAGAAPQGHRAFSAGDVRGGVLSFAEHAARSSVSMARPSFVAAPHPPSPMGWWWAGSREGWNGAHVRLATGRSFAIRGAPI